MLSSLDSLFPNVAQLPGGALINVCDTISTPSHFLIPYFLNTLIKRHEQRVILVCVNQSVGFYSTACRRRGLNLKQFEEQGLFKWIPILQVFKDLPDDLSNDATYDKLIDTIQLQVQNMITADSETRQGRKTSIIIDDVSSLQHLASSNVKVIRMLKALQDALSRGSHGQLITFTSMPNQPHHNSDYNTASRTSILNSVTVSIPFDFSRETCTDSEDSPILLYRYLTHKSIINIQVEPLKSGFSDEITGQIKVLRGGSAVDIDINNGSKLALYRLADNDVAILNVMQAASTGKIGR